MVLRRIFIFSILLYLWTAVSWAQPFERIVSLAPSLTKSLYYLEAGERLVGCTSYCEVDASENKAIIASAIQVNLEKLISLQPDLVIATTITNPETLASLSKFGIRVEVFSSPGSFDEICRQFIDLGKLLGKEQLAISIVRQSKIKVDSLSHNHSMKNNPSIFFQIGAKPLFTVIPNTFMNDYISMAGGRNLAADMNKGTITRESVLARDPDIIFIVTMGITGEEEKRIWESYSDMKAAKNRRIYIIDSNLSCTPTPVTFSETLEIMVNLLENNTVSQ